MATNYARFTIEGTPSEAVSTGNRGYDATNSQVLNVVLEASPSAPIVAVTYEVYDPAIPTSPFASKGATLLAWAPGSLSTVTPATPFTEVTVTMPPTGYHSWIIRARAIVSGESGEHVWERMVTIRTRSGDRKTCPGEVTQYEARGHSDTLNDMVDKLAAGAAFFGSYAAGGTVAGVAATPGWKVLSEFQLDALPATPMVLETIALVSSAALDCNLHLYDVTDAVVVTGSTLTTNSTTGDRLISGNLTTNLIAGHRYQTRIECVGGSAPTDGATARYVALKGI
jgi:hypothetical protein